MGILKRMHILIGLVRRNSRVLIAPALTEAVGFPMHYIDYDDRGSTAHAATVDGNRKAYEKRVSTPGGRDEFIEASRKGGMAKGKKGFAGRPDLVRKAIAARKRKK